MPLDGLRAWVGEVERKLGMRTRAFLVLATIAIGGAGAAIYLALDTRDNAVSESDVQALQEDLEAQIVAGGATGTGAELAQLEAEVKALEAEVEQLRGESGGGGGGGKDGSGGTGTGTGGASSGSGESAATPGESTDGGATAAGDEGGKARLRDLVEQAQGQNEQAQGQRDQAEEQNGQATEAP
jgi:cell division protein FtsB